MKDSDTATTQEINKFNQGYELARVNPKLAHKLMQNIDETSSSHLQYFKKGVKRFEYELQQENVNDMDRDQSFNLDR